MSPAWIDQLKLRALDPDLQANVAMASIPLSAGDHVLPAFKGFTSQTIPIAWHPGDQGPGLPRQVLVVGIGDDAPDEMSLAPASGEAVVDVRSPIAAPSADTAWAGPKWRITTVEEKKTGLTMMEVNELVLEHQGRRLGMRMGVELAGGGFHWWEWLQIEQLWTGPVCKAIRAAGYVGIKTLSEEEVFSPDANRFGAGNWFHVHNWLFCEIYAQIFVNGLVRITARHVNNRFFDQGRDLEGFVPVMAFNAPAPGSTGSAGNPGRAGVQQVATSLDGSRLDLPLGRVQLDLNRGADLFSPEHPAHIGSKDGLTIYQPFEGTEMLLGEGKPADRWNVLAKEKRMWKGMARTFAFDLSFADRPIRTRRYLPPYGYIAYCGALWPDAALAARGPLEPLCDRVLGKGPHYSPELGVKPLCSGRYSQLSGVWDGEIGLGFMRQAYRMGRRDLYEAAIHHAYAFADLGIDHADFTQQIERMPKGSIALPLQRNLGMLAVYLETGDPYLLYCAESLADTAYSIDRGNWPRRSFGRDSAYIRGLTHLYSVTGETSYLRRAGEACRRVIQCQRPDGSFADQGGANGAHAQANEIIKPWMNSILSEVLVDYLERAGRDPAIEAALIKTGDWLLSALLEDANGKYWPYQSAWGKNPEDPTSKLTPDKPANKHPVGDFHLDYNARTFLWLSRLTGDSKYERAWQSVFTRHCVKLGRLGGAYSNVKIPENYPWHEAHLWGAKWDGQKVEFRPMLELIEVGREATIELPHGGTVHVRRTEKGIETK